MYVLFKSNNWGQSKGFSARFTSEKSICGGKEYFEGQSLSIHSPYLNRDGVYRRGYLSCRWVLS